MDSFYLNYFLKVWFPNTGTFFGFGVRTSACAFGEGHNSAHDNVY